LKGPETLWAGTKGVVATSPATVTATTIAARQAMLVFFISTTKFKPHGVAAFNWNGRIIHELLVN
jgi:hypothetical protein